LNRSVVTPRRAIRPAPPGKAEQADRADAEQRRADTGDTD
jgi:hypothetical protein